MLRTILVLYKSTDSCL